MMDYFQAQSVIRNVNPREIIVFADYDLTLAGKWKNFFDMAPLSKGHRQIMADMTKNIGRFVVVTARGEKSVWKSLFDAHYVSQPRNRDITIASNSGFLVRMRTKPISRETITLEVPGYSTPDEFKLVQRAIFSVMDDMKKKFPYIIADYRELCGAVIYELNGDSQQKRNDLHACFHDLIYNSSNKHACYAESIGVDPSKLGEKISYSTKDIIGAGDSLSGYIDIVPRGLDKGVAVKKLFPLVMAEINKAPGAEPVKHPFVIVAGDSAPDYGVMRELANTFPKNRRLFIAVGNGIEQHDKDNKIVDITIRGSDFLHHKATRETNQQNLAIKALWNLLSLTTTPR